MRITTTIECSQEEIDRYPHLISSFSKSYEPDIETAQDCIDDLAGDLNALKNDIRLWKENTAKEMFDYFYNQKYGKKNKKAK